MAHPNFVEKTFMGGSKCFWDGYSSRNIGKIGI